MFIVVIYKQEVARWKVTEQLIKESIPASAKVLDIGSLGYYWPFDQYDVVSLGIDNRSTYVCDIQSQEVPSLVRERFDYICMFEVIEHLDDPIKALQNINRLSKDSALFLGSTPNKNDPYYIVFRKKHKDHKTIFTSQDLKGLFKLTGFNLVTIEPKVMPVKLPLGITLVKDANRLLPWLGRHLFWKCRKDESSITTIPSSESKIR